MSLCKGCGAVIGWYYTLAGERMPVDVEPAPDGTIVIRGGLAVVLTPLELLIPATPDQPRRRSHFATCPQADHYRKPRSPR